MAKRTPPPEQELTPAQETVIAQLLTGATDQEAAAAAGVTRKEIESWRAKDFLFVAEMNARRQAEWEARAERLRSMLPKAIDVLSACIDSEDDKVRMTAALHLLKACGMSDLKPAGETNPEAIKSDWFMKELSRSFRSAL